MRRSGHPEAKHAYNGVFATLQREGSRSADMAVRAGMTRQSMGEVIRELVALGILEMAPDPEDKRAKIVTYTDRGLEVAASGYDHLRDLEERFAAEFGPAEYSTARQVLARVADVLEEWASEADRASE
nr:MarR family winged helix-turn-helix transcriptional regulator [Kribbella sandramycini]